jgi:hypothetical protein
MSSRPRASNGRLDLVAPEGPEGVPLLRNIREGEARTLQKAVPDMNMDGTPAHWQPVQATPARPAVELHGRLDSVGIEQVQDWAKGGLEVGELVFVSPPPPAYNSAVQKVGRLPSRERGSGLVVHLILPRLNELDLLAASLLEGGDDLPNRLVLLGVEPLLPLHHEVGGLGTGRRHDDRRGKNDGSAAHCCASPMASTPAWHCC